MHMNPHGVRLNEHFALRDSGYSNSEHSVILRRHRWYPTKEAFSPYLVERAILETGCKEEKVILDPFCGSGTVPLVAAGLGLRAVGIEVNPFLAFVSRTKLISCSVHTFRRHVNTILTEIMRGKYSSLERYSTFGKTSANAQWLFNTGVLRAFEGGWNVTEHIRAPAKHLLRLCLIAAAMDNCNAKRDGKCFRYYRKWQELGLNAKRFRRSLQKYFDMVAEDLAAAPIPSRASTIVQGDCRRKLRSEELPQFKLCVTSPPYLNSFDYTDIYRPELFLGRFIAGSSELKALRHKTVRSHIQVNWTRAEAEFFGRKYTATMKRLKPTSREFWDVRIPLMIQAYFEDMEGVLRELYRLGSRQAQLWLVVATSAYGGIEIPDTLLP